ncbi:uncharacterized protein LOC143224883 isoform X2 [Tachypleus tridentatus]|uniref:uncharacterized protein LOC143224883 isoform X2 n=1 Tax=Tachypleus tridentatus TaxID=6853 RepID=UPI003FD32A65
MKCVKCTVKFEEEEVTKQTNALFIAHEDIGKISFALGRELVSTVNLLLSQGSKEQKDFHDVTWKITDKIWRNVQERSIDHLVVSVFQLLDNVEVKLKKHRSTLTLESNPYELVNFYLNINNMILNQCFNLDYKHQLPVPSVLHTLFIQGMSQRFGELGLGLIYVKSNLTFNKTEYLALRAGSTQLLSMSFHFIPRAKAKWVELHHQNPRVGEVLELVAEDILAGGQLQGKKELSKAYLDSVMEELAMLFLTKEVLNTTLSSTIERLTQSTRNTVAFNMSICIVALVVVIICLIISVCSFFRYIGLKRGEFY